MKRVLSIFMPVEWILIIFGVFIALIYRVLDLPMPGQPGAHVHDGPMGFLMRQVLTGLDLYCLVFLAFILFQQCSFVSEHRAGLSKAPWGDFWKRLSSRLFLEQIAQDLRFTVAIVLMFVEFGMLKNLIPHMNSGVYDEILARVDRAVCGGMLCSELLHHLEGRSEWMVQTVGQHYFWYYPYISLVGFIFVVWAPREVAQEYLCAFVALFLLGTVVIYAAPTWGPVYFEPAVFQFMGDSEIAGLQQSLWKMKLLLEQEPRNPEAIFMISGFPSLHIAVVTTGSIYLARLSKWLAAGSWIFLALTLNSTLYLGWHYLLDDLGALVLAGAAILLARRLRWRWRGCVEYGERE